MLRWMRAMFPAPKVRKCKAKAKKRVVPVRIRRSSVSNNLRLCRNIMRMA